MEPQKILTIFFLFLFNILLSQEMNTKATTTYHAGIKSEVLQVPLSAELHPDPNTKKWAVTVKPTTSRTHGLPEVNVIKASKLANKLASYTGVEENMPKAITPILGINFEATPMQFGTPPDNDMAISNDGIIISVNNDKIEYYNEDGTYLYGDYWDDFINNTDLTSGFFDPKVLYDSGSDRFILVVLHGSTASTSKIVTCFSKTNDPQDGWWIYQLTGNPLNDNSWLDYPSIAVSNDELFITGNLFSENTNFFNEAFIYQISKTDGYSGNSINFLTWSGLNNSPFNAFTLMPVGYGHEGNYGPGIYFVSNRSSGSNRIRLWNINTNIAGNPQINVSNIFTTNYSVGGNASQQGTTDMLDIGDCRIQDAFLLEDLIHFVFTSDIGNGYNGINYNRLDYTNLTNESNTIGVQGSYDYTYPSIESYSTNVTDKSVMIGFLRSSSNSYPEVRVVNCDDDFVFGNSTQVKAGETYVDVFGGTTERWGDYTGMSRRHNATAPTVWVCGGYGADISFTYDNRYKSWISEITNPPTIAPQANFTADVTTGNATLTVQFSDLSTNSPHSWLWNLPGGNPSTSTQKNPTVVYTNAGDFDVSLLSTNDIGSDTKNKTNYIHTNQNPAIGIIETQNDKNSFVYPNPIIDLFNIKFIAEDSKTIEIKLFNAKAQLIKTLYKGVPKQGENILNFNKNALSSGLYFVNISSENKTIKNEKIIIQ